MILAGSFPALRAEPTDASSPTEKEETAKVPHHGWHLGLTPEQQEKLKALREEYRPRFREAWKAKDKEKLRTLKKEYLAKAGEFLTPDQVKTLRFHHRKMVGCFHRVMHRRCPAPKLNLTEEQKAKAKELWKRHREELRTLGEKYRAEFRAILTPEQAEQWDVWWKQQKERHGHRHPFQHGHGPKPPAVQDAPEK